METHKKVIETKVMCKYSLVITNALLTTWLNRLLAAAAQQWRAVNMVRDMTP